MLAKVHSIFIRLFIVLKSILFQRILSIKFFFGDFRGLELSFRKGFFALGNLAKVNITLCFSKRYVCISSLT